MNRIFLAIICAGLFSANVMAAPAVAKTQQQVVQTAGGSDRDAAVPVDNETKLVVFNYDNNLVYNIQTQEGMMTHLELAPGEKVQGFYLSDSARWKHLVSQDKTRVFIKPTLPGLFNAATMVTTQRVYELTFRSGKPGEHWYQRVRWSINEFDMEAGSGAVGGVSEFARAPKLSKGSSDPAAMPSDAELALMGMPSLSGPSFGGSSSGNPKVQPDKLNFGYVIEGDASFRPLSVFDDGKFTWVQMSDSPALPALFLINEKGEMEIVNYTVHGKYLMVSQLVPGLLLRLGESEVKVSRKPECTSWWCRK